MWPSKKHVLTDYYIRSGLTEKHRCTPEENSEIAKTVIEGIPLNDEIYEFIDSSTIKGTGNYYRLQIISLLSKIKNMLIFFVTVTAVGIAAGLIYRYSLSRNFRY